MKIAVIGAGAMGEALLSGWIASGTAPEEIGVVDPAASRVADLERAHGVRGTDLATAAREAQTIVIAVKPYQVAEVLSGLAREITAETLVVSIAAGVTLAALEGGLPGVAVVRVMPNTPALVGEGMAGIVPGALATDEQVARVTTLMDDVGRSVQTDEAHLDALTALSGSGPAYLFYIAEVMIEGGVHQGLTRAQATELVNQTFVGSAALLAESGRSATQLREMVTSPGGTTAAALRALDDGGVRAAFLEAIERCRRRSAEMAAE